MSSIYALVAETDVPLRLEDGVWNDAILAYPYHYRWWNPQTNAYGSCHHWLAMADYYVYDALFWRSWHMGMPDHEVDYLVQLVPRGIGKVL